MYVVCVLRGGMFTADQRGGIFIANVFRAYRAGRTHVFPCQCLRAQTYARTLIRGTANTRYLAI